MHAAYLMCWGYHNTTPGPFLLLFFQSHRTIIAVFILLVPILNITHGTIKSMAKGVIPILICREVRNKVTRLP